MGDEENQAADSGSSHPVVGGFIYLVDRNVYAHVKAKVDDESNSKYECVIKKTPNSKDGDQ